MEATLTNGSIFKTLLRMASPTVLGFFAVISLNMVDTYFVAQLGTAELAAITFTFPPVMILMNLGLGLSIGVGSCISRAIGAKEAHLAKVFTTSSLLLGILLMGIIAPLNFDSMFLLMGAPTDLLPLVNAYMKIWCMGLPILIVPMIANTAINATGDAVKSALIMCLAAFSNLILDPILIFHYHLGMEGAALATVISYGVAFLLSFVILFQKRLLTIQISFKKLIDSWKKVLFIGVPAAATQMIIPLSNAGSLWMLSRFGAPVIAAYGIVCRLESFSLIAVIALGTSLSAFAGQNYGAKEYDRVSQALKLSFIISLVWGVFLALMFRLFGESLARAFDPDPKVVETVMLYLSIVPLTYGALGCVFVASSLLNAIGKPYQASLIAICRHFVLYLPMAYLAMLYFGPIGVFAAMAVVNLIAALTVYSFTSD